MRLICTVLLVCSLTVCVHAETRTLGLYIKHPERVSAQSGQMMRSELKRLLDPAGIAVVWKDFADRKAGEDFDFVVVGSIQGSCVPAKSDLRRKTNLEARVSLADATLAEDGVFPYFKVDCARMVRMLGRENSSFMVGRALARVMGHELYHIITGTTRHPAAGLAKAAFSVDDLTTPELDFDVASLARMSRVRGRRPGASRSHTSA
jgi:hypothetical protein